MVEWWKIICLLLKVSSVFCENEWWGGVCCCCCCCWWWRKEEKKKNTTTTISYYYYLILLLLLAPKCCSLRNDGKLFACSQSFKRVLWKWIIRGGVCCWCMCRGTSLPIKKLLRRSHYSITKSGQAGFPTSSCFTEADSSFMIKCLKKASPCLLMQSKSCWISSTSRSG